MNQSSNLYPGGDIQMDQNKVDELAASLLDHLTQILPDEDKGSELGRAALEKALETYNETAGDEEVSDGETSEEATE